MKVMKSLVCFWVCLFFSVDSYAMNFGQEGEGWGENNASQPVRPVLEEFLAFERPNSIQGYDRLPSFETFSGSWTPVENGPLWAQDWSSYVNFSRIESPYSPLILWLLSENSISEGLLEESLEVDLEESIEEVSSSPASAIILCPFPGCTRGFSDPKAFKYHSKTHLGKLPYLCVSPSCGFVAARKRDMALHAAEHQGKSVYFCSQCPYRGLNQSSLTKHFRVKHSPKQFKCANCAYSARTPEYLKLHEGIHLTVKPYRCKNCKFQTHRKGSYLRHRAKKHGD